MIDVALGVILNLLQFTAIGIGPALIFLSSEKRIEVALAIAPALGFALSSVFGTYLVLLDKPIVEWAFPWLVISIIISVILSFIRLKKYQFELASINWQRVKVFAIGLGLTTLLVLLPMVIGGINFTALRGNATDTLNYIVLAGYLDHEPYSWAFQVDDQTLIERHPSYLLVQQLLSTRWTTSAMLAFTSRIAGHPIYYFEYGFTALCFILAVGPAFWLALSTKLKPLYALLLSVAIAVGFWGQFVFDIRAMSQMNSISVLLLISLLIARIESNKSQEYKSEIILLSVSIISLIIFYVEIVPMFVLGLIIFFGTRLTKRVISIAHLSRYLISLGIIFIGLIPLSDFLIQFFNQQFQNAASHPNDWDKAYFSWFYRNPINGLWGLSYIEASKTVKIWLLSEFINGSLTGISLILVLVLGYSLIHLFLARSYPEATLLATSLALAALIQFFILWLRGQLWAAGKGLSFGYPFIMTSTVAFALTSSSIRKKIKGSHLLSNFIKIGVIFWLTLQCFLGVYRISFAFQNPEYFYYIWSPSEYKSYDWNLKPFNILQRQPSLTVWSLVSDEILAQYLNVALGWDLHIVNFISLWGNNPVVNEQTLSKFPDYVIAEKAHWQSLGSLDIKVAAQNANLVLVKTPQEFWSKPLILGIENPNGVEVDPEEKPWFWMGGKPTQLKLFSPIKGEIKLNARFQMGPSLPEQPNRRVLVRSSADKKQQKLLLDETTKEISFTVRQGINEVSLQVLDEPTLKVLPSGDDRPMLLRVDQWQLKLGKSSD